MMNLLGAWGHAVTIGIVGTLVALNGTVMHPVVVSAPVQASTPQTANVALIPSLTPPELIPLTVATTDTATIVASSALSLQTKIMPGLLPFVTLKNHATSTAIAPQKIIKTTPPITAPPTIITAAWVLAHTTTTFQQVYGGSYKVSLTTIVNNQTVPWSIDSTSFGGTNGIPLMTAASLCNPPPTSDPNVLNGEILFAVASPYTCSISLTPLTGDDRRTQSTTLSFMTPAGQLTVSRAASMNAVLVNNEDDGGIVFTNTDPNPITVTGLTLKISYRYLDTNTGPLVLRLYTPDTDQQLSNYHLENLPADPTLPYTNTQNNLNASVVFTIPGSSEKMLPVSVFGVDKMLISGTVPTITVNVQGITTSRPSVKTVFSDPTITWSCNVALGGYDPNATSGAFASGEACQG